MADGPARRRFLRSLAAAALAMPAAGCLPEQAAPLAEAAPFPSPEESGPRLALFIVPGLSSADLLVSTRDGTMPGLAAVLESGLLIEDVVPEAGHYYSLAETGHELLAGWRWEVEPMACQRWDLGTGVAASACEAVAQRDEAEACLASLRSLGEAAAALAAQPDSAEAVLLPCDALLSLAVDGMLVDSRQPNYSTQGALRSASDWRQALMGLDAAFSRCLLQVDLSAWAVGLVSTCSAEAVYANLDPGQIRGLVRVLPGRAAAEVAPSATWPGGAAWVQVQEAAGPGGSGRRLVAPPGYAFVSGEEPLPRAVPAQGGFVLLVGRGVPQGQRRAALSPHAAGELLARLAGGQSVSGS